MKKGQTKHKSMSMYDVVSICKLRETEQLNCRTCFAYGKSCDNIKVKRMVTRPSDINTFNLGGY